MNFLQRYWILEISLAVIVAGGLGLAAYNTFWAPAQAGATAVEASEISLVVDTAPAADSATQVTIVPREGIQAAGEDGVEGDEDEDNEFEEDVFDEAEDDEEEEEWFLFVDAAAQIIGMDVDELDKAMISGRSMAEIAAENGMDAQQLIDELIRQELAFIDEQVEKGVLPADEAAEWREEVSLWTPFAVNTPYREIDIVAAETLAIDPEEMWEALENGQTIEALAQSRDVAPQEVIDAVMASERAYAEQMAAAGLIDTAEIGEWLAETSEWVNTIVTKPLDSWEEAESDEE